jgi:putative tryptophan/tyrosine transport system substrate-binding protein
MLEVARAAGVAASLARPGGNVTGSTSFVPEESAKRLELLREAVPGIRRVAFLASTQLLPVTAAVRKAIEKAAGSMKIQLQDFAMTQAADLPDAFNAMTAARIDAVVVNNEPLLNSHAGAIAALAAVKRLPAAGYASFADAGGLIAYGANRPALYGRVGYFLDRILKGEKPGDIPFERATRFDLVVNRKTAKTLGIQIPRNLQMRADRVID